MFDRTHGRSHFSFRMIEKGREHGFLADTISSNRTMTSALNGPAWDVPTTMTKLLHFGMWPAEIVRRATAAPPRIMGCVHPSGA